MGFVEGFVNSIETLTPIQRKNSWNLLDIGIFLLSNSVTFLYFDGLLDLNVKTYAVYTLLTIVIYLFLSYFTKQINTLVRYSNVKELVEMFFNVAVSGAVSFVISVLIYSDISKRYGTLTTILSALGLIAIRLSWQLLYAKVRIDRIQSGRNLERVLVIGAGEGGYLFLQNLQRNPSGTEVIAILDDNPAKHGLTINGVPVVGGVELIPQLAKDHQIDKAIVAIPSISGSDYRQILKSTSQCGIPLHRMPSIESIILNRSDASEAPKVDIADLLGREEVKLDENKLQKELEGKTLLITGAGGSIGSEICRQVSHHNPGQVVLLGHGENSIYDIHKELSENWPNNIYHQVIADIKDYDRILDIFNYYKPDIVYHAAAHKHVPLMEMNPTEAFKNNIKGTYNVARAVDEAGVTKMVMLSTDKAVRPPNIMGASKRIAELIITAFAQKSKSVYCAVRFGNVLRSRGSVIPVFEEQIANGGPVAVTDFRMTRYFMTIPEASRLVIYAGAYAESGEIFVLDMGEPVRIYDLAQNLILLSGKRVEDIGIVEIGIRPGEKIYEELLTDEENIHEKLDDKIFIGKSTQVSLDTLDQLIHECEGIADDELKEIIIKFANKTC